MFTQKRVSKQLFCMMSLKITVYPKKYAYGFALLCFVVVIHWLIFPYPSGLLHWHCGNLTIAPVPAKQPWWIWINTSCEFIMNDCITTTKQSTTKPCAYFLGYTVYLCTHCHISQGSVSWYVFVCALVHKAANMSSGYQWDSLKILQSNWFEATNYINLNVGPAQSQLR